MEQKQLMEILDSVAEGTVTPEAAMLKIKMQPYKELEQASIDTHRAIRQGIAEVIYGAGKTKEQILEITQAMLKEGQQLVLITRMSAEAANYLKQYVALNYDEISRIGWIGKMPEPDGNGTIVVATGGTSDIPVAKEASLTAQAFGNQVISLYDIGVAGMHRMLGHMEELMSAQVIIAIAGMEGALASVIGGMVDCPVIAVPTSVGYGAGFGGLSALLSMLNSCASGVSVVNIDNGYGAGYLASMINHLPGKPRKIV